MPSSQDGIENESEKIIYLHVIYSSQSYNTYMSVQWNNKKRNINWAKVKEKYVGIRNHLFSYTYILMLQILNKIFEINLAPSINSCSLESNPRDNSVLQQLWIFVVLSAPTNDFSSRSFRASPLSLSLSSPTGCFRFFFPRARFSSRLYARSLVASLCLHAPSVL